METYPILSIMFATFVVEDKHYVPHLLRRTLLEEIAMVRGCVGRSVHPL